MKKTKVKKFQKMNSQSGPSVFPWEIVHILKNFGPRLGEKGEPSCGSQGGPRNSLEGIITSRKGTFAPKKTTHPKENGGPLARDLRGTCEDLIRDEEKRSDK